MTKDPSQSLAFPHAIITLGSTPGGSPSTASVAIDSQTQTATVDVTSSAQGWIVKQPPTVGLVFKSPYDCGLIHPTQIRLFLDHSVLSAAKACNAHRDGLRAWPGISMYIGGRLLVSSRPIPYTEQGKRWACYLFRLGKGFSRPAVRPLFRDHPSPVIPPRRHP
jgi:hypothetical protein